MYWQKASGKVTKHLHALDGSKSFVGVIVGIVPKEKFLVKEESKITHISLCLRIEPLASLYQGN